MNKPLTGAILLLALVVVHTNAQVASVDVVRATYARSMTASYEPIDPTDQFARGETIYLCVELRGQNLRGTISARFLFGEQELTTAQANLTADSAGDPAAGLNTTVGFSLRQMQNFPVGANYRTDLFHEGIYLGSWFFRIVPPADAIPSFLHTVSLSRSVDDNYRPVDRSTLFAPADTVHLTGSGDTGVDSWLQAEWIVNGAVDDRGTRSLTMLENKAANSFTFYYAPQGGWPRGEHAVELQLDGVVICRIPFSVR